MGDGSARWSLAARVIRQELDSGLVTCAGSIPGASERPPTLRLVFISEQALGSVSGIASGETRR